MQIPRKEYCQVHLDEWKEKLAVTDWFEYLDQPDRLMRVLERGYPFSISTMEHIEKNPEFVYWEEFSALITSNWYGIWPNATTKELEVSEAVAQLHEDWWKSGGFHDTAPFVQDALKASYNKIVKDYENHLSSGASE
ncbi:hypothetical protein [Marinobacterium sp. xm-d-564]|uniref:hypothetical protein n=1 Tax=Marinobacterium sp. xm-d-564 TaxID=2497742 RepID=UPI00156851B4|nr:hypothetical protein [Marinobacterium sp. xm-d-564]NRP59220.1 hypothetical protein [Marinobacterium sp. xm-d-564]